MLLDTISLEGFALDRVRARQHDADLERRLRGARDPNTPAWPARFAWLAAWRGPRPAAERMILDGGRRGGRCCVGVAPG